MSQPLRILILEDRPVDAELVLREVQKAGIECTTRRVDTKEDFLKQLQEFRPDLILADYSLPSYDGMSALAAAQEVCPDVPFILVSGTLGEDTAVESLHRGATDYILKQRLSRVGPAVRRALLEVEKRNQLRQIERRLRASEVRYRRLFESAKEGIVLLDAETGIVVDVNPFLVELLGHSGAQLLGKSIWEVGCFKDIVANQSAFLKWQQSEVVRYDALTMEASDGRRIEVEFVGNAYAVNDRRVIQCNIRDITQRRRTEESLRLESAALHAAAEAIVITDRAGVIVRVNPAFNRLTGYTNEEALGRDPRDLVKSGKHPPEFYKDFWETILAGRTWHGETINRRKDGSLYTEDQSVTPIRDGAGAITHFVAIKKDITERLQLEAQFRQAQRMEAVGQLTSGIAHDFNNLLTVINGMAELVLEHVVHDDPLRADVEEIRRAGGRAAALTRQLLAFSRQQILEPRVMNLNMAVGGMESLLLRLLGEDIHLAIVPTPELGHIKADSGQIEQVITNLAVNARDAMPQGGRLTLETRNVTIDDDYARQRGVAEPSGSYVMLAVSDTGSGMDETVRARIFEPFFTTKGAGKGTGLGLSTVFGIVKQSLGFIEVQSEVGQGTSFKIFLPQVSTAAGADRAKPTERPVTGTETILIVEDNAGLLKLAARILEPAGYTILGAATGEEALQLLERHERPVHLLLTDVVMPGMSGRHLAERLAQIRPGMKVLYMSGYTGDMIVRHGVLEAQTPFINKPFSAPALLRKVREVLDAHLAGSS